MGRLCSVNLNPGEVWDWHSYRDLGQATETDFKLDSESCGRARAPKESDSARSTDSDSRMLPGETAAAAFESPADPELELRARD